MAFFSPIKSVSDSVIDVSDSVIDVNVKQTMSQTPVSFVKKSIRNKSIEKLWWNS